MCVEYKNHITEFYLQNLNVGDHLKYVRSFGQDSIRMGVKYCKLCYCI